MLDKTNRELVYCYIRDLLLIIYEFYKKWTIIF